MSILNTPPVASFTLGCGSLTCTANGSGSSDAEGPLTNYAWSFGDGTAASGQTVTHTYSAAGSYIVSLTVTDNDGATRQPRAASPSRSPRCIWATWRARLNESRTPGTRS